MQQKNGSLDDRYLFEHPAEGFFILSADGPFAWVGFLGGERVGLLIEGQLDQGLLTTPLQVPDAFLVAYLEEPGSKFGVIAKISDIARRIGKGLLDYIERLLAALHEFGHINKEWQLEPAEERLPGGGFSGSGSLKGEWLIFLPHCKHCGEIESSGEAKVQPFRRILSPCGNDQPPRCPAGSARPDSFYGPTLTL